MKKSFLTLFWLAIMACGLFLVAGVHVVKADSKTITVPDDFTTIQAAVDNATAGDTVFVKKGTYNETVEINKPLSLIGEDRSSTIIMGKGEVYGSSPPLIDIDAPNVTVSGFTITHSDFVGITINPAAIKCTIKDNIITDTDQGIHTYEVRAYATGLVYSTDILISGNYIANNSGYGIYCSSYNTTISENVLAFNGATGLIIDSASNVTVSFNRIEGNGQSKGDPALLARVSGGLYLRWLGPFDVHGNNITENNGYGIQFGEMCNNSTIHENIIERNDIGIKLLNFLINESETSTFGLGNIVYRNDLIDNSMQVLIEKSDPSHPDTTGYVNGTDSVSWDNGKEGNYWSDYQTRYPNATEIDSSGLGDTPYVIDANNTDHYPLTKLVAIPEFPSWRILPLAMFTVSLAVLASKRKRKILTNY